MSSTNFDSSAISKDQFSDDEVSLMNPILNLRKRKHYSVKFNLNNSDSSRENTSTESFGERSIDISRQRRNAICKGILKKKYSLKVNLDETNFSTEDLYQSDIITDVTKKITEKKCRETRDSVGQTSFERSTIDEDNFSKTNLSIISEEGQNYANLGTLSSKKYSIGVGLDSEAEFSQLSDSASEEIHCNIGKIPEKRYTIGIDFNCQRESTERLEKNNDIQSACEMNISEEMEKNKTINISCETTGKANIDKQEITTTEKHNSPQNGKFFHDYDSGDSLEKGIHADLANVTSNHKHEQNTETKHTAAISHERSSIEVDNETFNITTGCMTEYSQSSQEIVGNFIKTPNKRYTIGIDLNSQGDHTSEKFENAKDDHPESEIRNILESAEMSKRLEENGKEQITSPQKDSGLSQSKNPDSVVMGHDVGAVICSNGQEKNSESKDLGVHSEFEKSTLGGDNEHNNVTNVTEKSEVGITAGQLLNHNPNVQKKYSVKMDWDCTTESTQSSQEIVCNFGKNPDKRYTIGTDFSSQGDHTVEILENAKHDQVESVRNILINAEVSELAEENHGKEEIRTPQKDLDSFQHKHSDPVIMGENEAFGISNNMQEKDTESKNLEVNSKLERSTLVLDNDGNDVTNTSEITEVGTMAGKLLNQNTKCGKKYSVCMDLDSTTECSQNSQEIVYDFGKKPDKRYTIGIDFNSQGDPTGEILENAKDDQSESDIRNILVSAEMSEPAEENYEKKLVRTSQNNLDSFQSKNADTAVMGHDISTVISNNGEEKHTESKDIEVYRKFDRSILAVDNDCNSITNTSEITEVGTVAGKLLNCNSNIAKKYSVGMDLDSTTECSQTSQEIVCNFNKTPNKRYTIGIDLNSQGDPTAEKLENDKNDQPESEKRNILESAEMSKQTEENSGEGMISTLHNDLDVGAVISSNGQEKNAETKDLEVHSKLEQSTLIVDNEYSMVKNTSEITEIGLTAGQLLNCNPNVEKKYSICMDLDSTTELTQSSQEIVCNFNKKPDKRYTIGTDFNFQGDPTTEILENANDELNVLETIEVNKPVEENNEKKQMRRTSQKNLDLIQTENPDTFVMGVSTKVLNNGQEKNTESKDLEVHTKFERSTLPVGNECINVSNISEITEGVISAGHLLNRDPKYGKKYSVSMDWDCTTESTQSSQEIVCNFDKKSDKRYTIGTDFNSQGNHTTDENAKDDKSEREKRNIAESADINMRMEENDGKEQIKTQQKDHDSFQHKYSDAVVTGADAATVISNKEEKNTESKVLGEKSTLDCDNVTNASEIPEVGITAGQLLNQGPKYRGKYSVKMDLDPMTESTQRSQEILSNFGNNKRSTIETEFNSQSYHSEERMDKNKDNQSESDIRNILENVEASKQAEKIHGKEQIRTPQKDLDSSQSKNPGEVIMGHDVRAVICSNGQEKNTASKDLGVHSEFEKSTLGGDKEHNNVTNVTEKSEVGITAGQLLNRYPNVQKKYSVKMDWDCTTESTQSSQEIVCNFGKKTDKRYTIGTDFSSQGDHTVEILENAKHDQVESVRNILISAEVSELAEENHGNEEIRTPQKDLDSFLHEHSAIVISNEQEKNSEPISLGEKSTVGGDNELNNVTKASEIPKVGTTAGQLLNHDPNYEKKYSVSEDLDSMVEIQPSHEKACNVSETLDKRYTIGIDFNPQDNPTAEILKNAKPDQSEREIRNILESEEIRKMPEVNCETIEELNSKNQNEIVSCKEVDPCHVTEDLQISMTKDHEGRKLVKSPIKIAMEKNDIHLELNQPLKEKSSAEVQLAKSISLEDQDVTVQLSTVSNRSLEQTLDCRNSMCDQSSTSLTEVRNVKSIDNIPSHYSPEPICLNLELSNSPPIQSPKDLTDKLRTDKLMEIEEPLKSVPECNDSGSFNSSESECKNSNSHNLSDPEKLSIGSTKGASKANNSKCRRSARILQKSFKKLDSSDNSNKKKSFSACRNSTNFCDENLTKTLISKQIDGKDEKTENMNAIREAGSENIEVNDVPSQLKDAQAESKSTKTPLSETAENINQPEDSQFCRKKRKSSSNHSSIMPKRAKYNENKSENSVKVTSKNKKMPENITDPQLNKSEIVSVGNQEISIQMDEENEATSSSNNCFLKPDLSARIALRNLAQNKKKRRVTFRSSKLNSVIGSNSGSISRSDSSGSRTLLENNMKKHQYTLINNKTINDLSCHTSLEVSSITQENGKQKRKLIYHSTPIHNIRVKPKHFPKISLKSHIIEENESMFNKEPNQNENDMKENTVPNMCSSLEIVGIHKSQTIISSPDRSEHTRASLRKRKKSSISKQLFSERESQIDDVSAPNVMPQFQQSLARSQSSFQETLLTTYDSNYQDQNASTDSENEVENTTNIKDEYKEHLKKLLKKCVKPAENKVPKLFKPVPWINDKLYAYLYEQLYPKYKLETRKVSEEYAIFLFYVYTRVTHGYIEPALSELKAKLKELGLCKTQLDFVTFMMKTVPLSFYKLILPIPGANGCHITPKVTPFELL